MRQESLAAPVCEMVSITVFLPRAAILSFDPSHHDYRTVGIWVSCHGRAGRAWRALCGFQGTQRMLSTLLLTSPLTLGTNVWVSRPFSILGPSLLLQINDYVFGLFPDGIVFWISLGFLVEAMINHVINTVTRNQYIMSVKKNKRKLNRLLVVGMGAWVLSRVIKMNLEPKKKVPIAIVVQEQKEGIFLCFSRFFFWTRILCSLG